MVQGRRRVEGRRLLSASVTGLVFEGVLHFSLAIPDHVAHVADHRTAFGQSNPGDRKRFLFIRFQLPLGVTCERQQYRHRKLNGSEFTHSANVPQVRIDGNREDGDSTRHDDEMTLFSGTGERHRRYHSRTLGVCYRHPLYPARQYCQSLRVSAGPASPLSDAHEPP